MGELERTLTHREFLEWQALWRIQPWGPQQDDARIAVLTSIVANMFRGEDVAVAQPWELFPWMEAPEAPQQQVIGGPSPEEVSANILKHFFPAHMAQNRATLQHPSE